MTDTGLSRRERQRQATMDEIVQTARGQLSEPGGLTLRSIAQEMGITAPALYRYVSSLEDLTLLVTASVYDEIVDVLGEAAHRNSKSPEAQIIAAAAAYRRWSLHNRDEFALCFLNSQATDPDDPAQNACAVAGERFRGFFAELFVEIWNRRPFDLPLDAEYAEIEAVLNDPMNPFRDDHRQWQESSVPVAVQWTFLQVWTRLFGIVALEAFGHIAAPIVTSGMLFRSVVARCAETLGIDAEILPDLATIIDAELAR